MANGWGTLASVCAFLLFVAGTWPSRETRISSTAQSIVDPEVARYDYFNPEEASLKLVQVVFRHGARTPLNALYNFQGVNWTHCNDHYQGVEVELHDESGGAQAPPILDPNTPVLPGGCRQGTLTEAGYQMALDVGTWLRSRYVAAGGPTGGFLPDMGPEVLSLHEASVSASFSTKSLSSWNSAVATLRTTPVRRTIATLRGILTGLWPRLAGPAEAFKGPNTSTPVLPVGASVESREIMYGNNNTCARLGPLHEAMQRDLDDADARDAELLRLNRIVADALGLDPEKAILWPKLYDHLAAMIADGASMPVGATREVLDIIWAQAERHEAGVIAPSTDLCASLGPGDADSGGARERRCHEVLRLGIGMLVRRLLDNMETHVKANGARQITAAPATSKLYLFSGHDSSIMPLLAVLGQPAKAWPPFASHLVFELWQAKAADKKATAAAAAGTMGRRGHLTEIESLSRSSPELRQEDSEQWVRILYNGAPLVVPGTSNTAGWAPLRVLRKRTLLPFAITLAEHAAVCSRIDISDLEQAPLVGGGSWTAASGGGGSDRNAAAMRDRLTRHAML